MSIFSAAVAVIAAGVTIYQTGRAGRIAEESLLLAQKQNQREESEHSAMMNDRVSALEQAAAEQRAREWSQLGEQTEIELIDDVDRRAFAWLESQGKAHAEGDKHVMGPPLRDVEVTPGNIFGRRRDR